MAGDRLAALLFLLIAVLAVGGMIAYSFQQSPSNDSARPSEGGMGGAKDPPQVQHNNREKKGDWYSAFREHPTDWLLVLFNGLLVVSTVALFLSAEKSAEAAKEAAKATRKSVELAERSADLQLRAYLTVLPGTFFEFDPQKRLVFRYHVENSGETPAYNVRHRASIALVANPLPDDHTFPEIPTTEGKTFLPKGIRFNGTAIADRKFSKEELITILRGSVTGTRFFVFGEVTYETLGKSHYTKFAYSFPGSHNFIPLAEQDNWNAIKERFASTGPMFDLAPRYNEAD